MVYRRNTVRKRHLHLACALLCGALFTAPASLGHAQTAPPEEDLSELPPEMRGGLDPELSGAGRQADEPKDPLRIIGGIGGGLSLRLARNLDFQQERFAPAFLDLYAGLILPGARGFRHGFTVGVSANLSGDGSFSLGMDPFEQFTITPGYIGRIQLDDSPVADFLLLLKVGIPLTVSPDFAPGLEVGIGATYLFLTGLGIYAEVSASAFMGGDSPSGSFTIHPLLSGELGIYVDFEVLP